MSRQNHGTDASEMRRYRGECARTRARALQFAAIFGVASVMKWTT